MKTNLKYAVNRTITAGARETAVRSRIALLRSRYGLSKTLSRHRIPNWKWTTADIAKVIEMRKNRKKVREIAAELDTSESAIKNMLHTLRKEGRL